MQTQELQLSHLYLRYRKHCTMFGQEIPGNPTIHKNLMIILLLSLCPTWHRFSPTLQLLYEWPQTCSPQLAPSTMAMQNASVRDVLRKI